jgi:hypothetical protein
MHRRYSEVLLYLLAEIFILGLMPAMLSPTLSVKASACFCYLKSPHSSQQLAFIHKGVAWLRRVDSKQGRNLKMNIEEVIAERRIV